MATIVSQRLLDLANHLQLLNVMLELLNGCVTVGNLSYHECGHCIFFRNGTPLIV